MKNEDMNNKENISDELMDELSLNIRDGLNASFDADGISVSEELIAKTLGAVKAAEGTDKAKWFEEDKPVVRFSTRFWKIAGSIAAVVVLGVVGIGIFAGSGRGIGKMNKSESIASDCAEKSVMYDLYSGEDMFEPDSDAESYVEDSKVSKYSFTVKSAEEAAEEYCETPMFAAAECNEAAVEDGMPDNSPEEDNLYTAKEYEPAITADYIQNNVESIETWQKITDYLESVRGELISSVTGSTDEVETELLSGSKILFDASYFGNGGRQNYNITVFDNRYFITNAPFVSSSVDDYTFEMYNLDDGFAVADELNRILNENE